MQNNPKINKNRIYNSRTLFNTFLKYPKISKYKSTNRATCI